jgi:hypothetical protein
MVPVYYGSFFSPCAIFLSVEKIQYTYSTIEVEATLFNYGVAKQKHTVFFRCFFYTKSGILENIRKYFQFWASYRRSAFSDKRKAQSQLFNCVSNTVTAQLMLSYDR